MLTGGSRRLCVIVEKMLEARAGRDVQALREVFDRLDGRPPQAIEYGYVSVEMLSDGELFAIIREGSCEPVDEPSYAMIARAYMSKKRLGRFGFPDANRIGASDAPSKAPENLRIA